jgi:SAM-dependent methyltransferase
MAWIFKIQSKAKLMLFVFLLFIPSTGWSSEPSKMINDGAWVLIAKQEEAYPDTAECDKRAWAASLPFDEPTLADTLRVLGRVEGLGVEIARRSILDIGCGTGIYTLPLAREAAMVTGLDDSEAMLARMVEAASAAGLQNVGPVTASWKTLDPAAHGLEKAFDIAWVSMSPAVQTLSDFEKMEQCARAWCVYIGWGRKRKNNLMEEIFELHGLPFGPPPGAVAA